MRFRYLVTVEAEQVKGFTSDWKYPQGLEYPQSRQNHAGLSNKFLVRTEGWKCDSEGIFQGNDLKIDKILHEIILSTYS
jgi:hypothetical protein